MIHFPPVYPVAHSGITEEIKKSFIGTIETIKFVANKTFETVAFLYSIPARYVGSKIWLFWNSSSYEFKLTPLSREEVKEFVVPAAISACVHGVSEPHMATFGAPFGCVAVPPSMLQMDGLLLPGNLQRKPFCFYDPQTHLKVMVAFNERGEATIAFGALESGLSEESNMFDPHYKEVQARIRKEQYLDVAGNLLGTRLFLYKQASLLTQMILQSPALQGRKVNLVGQSLGGSLAQYVGIDLGIPTIAFNALQLGAGQQYELGTEKLAKAALYVRHLCIKRDFVSDPHLTLPDQAIGLFGLIRTPGNFGKCFTIPSAYKTYSQTHDFVLGSLMNYIGQGQKMQEVNDLGYPAYQKNQWNPFKKQFMMMPISPYETPGPDCVPIYVNSRTTPNHLPALFREELKRVANSPVDVKIHIALKENTLPSVDFLRYAIQEFGLFALTAPIGAPSEEVKWQLLHAASACLKPNEPNPIHYGDWFSYTHLNEVDLACLFNIINSYQQYLNNIPLPNGNLHPHAAIFRSLAFDIRDHFMRYCFTDRAKAERVLTILKATHNHNLELERAIQMLESTLNPYTYAPIFHPLASKTGGMVARSLQDAKIERIPSYAPTIAPRKVVVWKLSMEGSSSERVSTFAHKNIGLENVHNVLPLYAEDKMKYDLKFKGTVRHEFNGKMVTSTVYKNKVTGDYFIQPDPEYKGVFDTRSQRGSYSNLWYSTKDDLHAYMASATAAAAATYCGKKANKSVDVLQVEADYAGGAAFELMRSAYDEMRENAGLKQIQKVVYVDKLNEEGADQGAKASTFLTKLGVNLGLRRSVNLTHSALTLSDATVFASNGLMYDALSTDRKINKGLREAVLSGGHFKLRGKATAVDSAQYDVANPLAYGIFSVKNDQYLAMQNEVKAHLYAHGIIADPVKPLALFTSDFTDEKGISMLSSALAEVKRQGGQMVVMGKKPVNETDPSDFIEQMKALAASPEYIGCLRFYSEERIPSEFLKTPFDPNCQVTKGQLIRQAASIAIIPSLENENGEASMEMQHAGAITVAPYIQGIRDVCVPAYSPDITGATYTLQTGANAIIYRNPQDPTALVQAVGAAFFSYKAMTDGEKNLMMKRIHDHAVQSYAPTSFNVHGQITKGPTIEMSRLYHGLAHATGMNPYVESFSQALERRKKYNHMMIPALEGG